MEKGALAWLLLSVAAAAAAAQKGVGDACRAKGGAEGACLPIGDCPSARDALRRGQAPTTCFFQGFLPIVCCPGPARGPSTPSPSPPPTLTPTPSPSPSPSPSPAQPERVASRMCSKYAEAVYYYETTFQIPKRTLKKSGCADNGVPFIVNGVRAVPSEFPHMALLGYHAVREQPTWLCGGSLISERFVLTAAHCFTSEAGAPKVVRLGELNLKATNEPNKHEDFGVAQVIEHPDYNASSHYNDLGLLRLDRDVSLTPAIRPLCLHTQADIGSVDAIATGWGHTDWAIPEISDHLMKVKLPIQKTELCQNAYKTLSRTFLLAQGIKEDSMVCAGAVDGKDTCRGDSGGPLQLKLETPYCMYSLVGITSFGKGSCGFGNQPAVYTRVSHYAAWLESVVWPNEK